MAGPRRDVAGAGRVAANTRDQRVRSRQFVQLKDITRREGEHHGNITESRRVMILGDLRRCASRAIGRRYRYAALARNDHVRSSSFPMTRYSEQLVSRQIIQSFSDRSRPKNTQLPENLEQFADVSTITEALLLMVHTHR